MWVSGVLFLGGSRGVPLGDPRAPDSLATPQNCIAAMHYQYAAKAAEEAVAMVKKAQEEADAERFSSILSSLASRWLMPPTE